MAGLCRLPVPWSSTSNKSWNCFAVRWPVVFWDNDYKETKHLLRLRKFCFLNSLSPSSDQYLNSPYNDTTCSNTQVMKMKVIITKIKKWNVLMFEQILTTCITGNGLTTMWRICMFILGFKGLKHLVTWTAGATYTRLGSTFATQPFKRPQIWRFNCRKDSSFNVQHFPRIFSTFFLDVTVSFNLLQVFVSHEN